MSKGFKQMIKYLLPFALVTFFVVTLIIFIEFTGQPMELKIGTADAKGTYYPLGDQLAWLLRNGIHKGIYPSIRSAEALVTGGSVENLEVLTSGVPRFNIALVGKSKLIPFKEKSDTIRILTKLHTSKLQIVKRKDVDITYLKDLNRDNPPPNKYRIFIGKEGSGNRRTAIEIFKFLHIPEFMYVVDEKTEDYSDVIKKLITNKLDIAICLVATPDPVIASALRNGCKLISIGAKVPDYIGDEVTIKESTYENQEFPVLTVGDPAYLICKADIKNEVVVSILDALFENPRDLQEAHPAASEILVENLKYPLPGGFKEHIGVEEFKKRNKSKLVIVTGAAMGSYYEAGKIIKGLLAEQRISSIVLPSDGSLKNLESLREDKPTLAILQYDVALAAFSFSPEVVYKDGPPEISLIDGKKVKGSRETCKKLWGIDKVEHMRRIATLHEEVLFIFAKKNRDGKGKSSTKAKFDLLNRKGAKICFGPPNSGTQLLARIIFGESKGELKRGVFASVEQMIREFKYNKLDMGFFVTTSDSKIVEELLLDESITLISVPVKTIGRVRCPAIKKHEMKYTQMIENGNKELTTNLNTVKTNAVLVVNDKVETKFVEKITEAILEGSDYFIKEENISKEKGIKKLISLSSLIPLHPAAEKYYKKKGHLPSWPKVNWLNVFGKIAGSIITILTLCSILIRFRNQIVANRREKEIISVELGPGFPNSVRTLSKIQVEIQGAVKKRWWAKHALSMSRWRSIDELIERRIKLARQYLTRSLVGRIHGSYKNSEKSKETIAKKLQKIQEEIWDNFENGELDTDQHDFLLKLIPDEYKVKQIK